MITFGYLAGWNETIEDSNSLSFANRVTDALSVWGTLTWRDMLEILADFDGIIYVTGNSLIALPTLIKELQGKESGFLPRKTLQPWNELIFNLYPDNSTIGVLRAGNIRGVGVCCPEQRLYGGHLLISNNCIELSISLSSTDILFELWGDIILGLQSLMAIISNLENADLIGDITEWRLTLRPGMLYEEIFNGREENS